MFGDSNWLDHRSHAQEERLGVWLREHRAKRLVIIECGAGTAIPSVRRFSEFHGQRPSATLVRINMRECEAPSDVGIAAGALEAITAIDAILS